MRAVLDASAALGAVLPDEDQATAPYAVAVMRAVLAGELEPVVPAVWHAEVAGVLLRRLRARTLSSADFAEALTFFRSMRIETHHPLHTVESLIERAQRLRLQAIDVLYFDLASSLGLPIATVDRGLRSAARSHGVDLVTPAAS